MTEKIQKAMRWYDRLYALYFDAHINKDVKRSYFYKKQADRLYKAIQNVKINKTNKLDIIIFDKAVSNSEFTYFQGSGGFNNENHNNVFSRLQY